MSLAAAYLKGYDAATKLVEAKLRKMEALPAADTDTG